MRTVLLLTAAYLAYGISAEAAKRSGPKSTSICAILREAVEAGTPSQKLDRFLSAQWKYTMTESPEFATYAGYPGQNDRWTDYSLTAITRRKNELRCQLDNLNKIPSTGLQGEERVSFDLAKRDLENAIEGSRFPSEYMLMDHLGGVHMDAADMVENMPRGSVKDLENILARLDKLPVLVEQTQALMQEGLRQRVTAVKMFMSRVPGQFDKVLTPKVEDSPVYAPFKDLGPDFTAEQKADLQKRAREVIQAKVYPALQKLKQFVVTEYIPHSREFISFTQMPNGKAWYAYLVKNHTTTSMTPEQLHELGLKEVARIRGEMDKIRNEVKFSGDLQDFNRFLMKDKQFYFKDKEQLLVAFRDIAKRIDPELPKVFKTLPRLTYGVKDMPDYKATDAPAAYYMPGSLEAGRAGWFVANTTDLSGRPKWGMEALTVHEAVPGHHLQISIAQEIKSLPDFRRRGGHTAYTEGWGLYAESLAPQLGLLKDPYSRYGALSYEMWRAIRLVVDTGIHAKGWSRTQAIEYFQANMPKSMKETENEVDRYISWPGQALAYKVGQLKFIEMREKARAELGEKFDLREFHDEVLRHGSLPLDVLEKTVGDWIAAQKKAAAKKFKEKV